MPNFQINVGVPGMNKAKKELGEKIAAAYSALRRQFIAEGTAFTEKWGDSARKKLKTSNNYINHIREEITENEKETIFTISHDYTLSNGLSLTTLLEDGYGPFDMKSSLFTGKNVKVSKKGYLYRYVPFNFHKPYKEGVMVTPPHITDDMYEAFQKMEKAGLIDKKGFVVMTPSNLKSAGYSEIEAKNLIGQRKTKTGNYNLKDVNLSKQINTPSVHFESLQHSKKKIFSVNYKWKTEQFMKMQKKKGGTGGKVYTTFSTIRTMSSKPSQRQAWINPGLKPLNIFKEVYEAEKDAIPKRLQVYFEEFLKGTTEG